MRSGRGPICTLGGSCSRQRASAKPQRGANEQLARRLVERGRRSRNGFQPLAAFGAVDGGGQQAPRIGMDRRAHDLAERALLDDLARIHHRDAVADFDRDPDIVGDEDHRHAELALQFAQQQQDLDLHGGIERRGRLVREQDFRLAGQRQRDHRALAHAAGHLVRIGVEPALGGGNPHHLQHFQRARHRLALALAFVAHHGFRDLLADGVDRIERQRRLLEDHRDGLAAKRRQFLVVERQHVAAEHLERCPRSASASSATAASARARSRSCPNRTRRAARALRPRRAKS